MGRAYPHRACAYLPAVAPMSGAIAGALVALVLLVACGGGGGGSSSNTIPPPTPVDLRGQTQVAVAAKNNVFNPQITAFGNFLGRIDNQRVYLDDDPTLERIDNQMNLREAEFDFRAPIDPRSSRCWRSSTARWTRSPRCIRR